MEIHWRNVDEVHPDTRARVEERLRVLAGEHGDLIDLWITGSRSAHHRHGDQEVRLRCLARGREIVAARTRPDLGQALDEVVDAFEREVWRLRDRRTDLRNLRPTEPPELGVVDRVFGEKGYGFILTDGGERVYFHRNAVHHVLVIMRAFGIELILDVDAGDASALELLDCPPHRRRRPEAVLGIGDDGDALDGAHDRRRVVGHLAQADEPGVGRAQPRRRGRVGADVDRLEARALDQARAHRVVGARCDDDPGPRQELPQAACSPHEDPSRG